MTPEKERETERETMRTSLQLVFLFFLLLQWHHSQAQLAPSTEGHTCSANTTTGGGGGNYPCQAYAFYRASSPDYLDLASIGDLFQVSRLMISKPSNISSPTSPLLPGEQLFVPLTCSCNAINTTYTISYANLTYTIRAGDTFYYVSSNHFQNLTTYQSVELVNPSLVPTLLQIGVSVIFPVFCKCPDRTQMGDGVSTIVSYVFQPSDDLKLVASRFGVDSQDIVDANDGRRNFQNYEAIFVPVKQLPELSQPVVPPVVSTGRKTERKGLVIGLAVGLGIVAAMLVLVIGVWGYRERVLEGRRRRKEKDEEERVMRSEFRGGKRKEQKGVEVNLMADVSECLDKYKVFKANELKEATDGFSESCLIQGSVYRGAIGGELYAIKKMKWNAYEELKILQKVNHGNLVRLEGFCIDSEDANCYLVYEYVENGSLHSWVHGENPEKLDWKTRLRIAIDIANGLQYIHEHTRPRVVHKDIKSSNILIDTNFRAKIANFGLARSGFNAITMHIVGTQGYIAPEYLADGVVSTKMDVFSFGVVLLELVSGQEAVDEDGKVLWAKVDHVLEGNEETKLRRLKGWMDERLLEGTCPVESVMNVMTIAVACLQRDPTRRPSMMEIVYALSKSDDLFFDVSDDSLSSGLVTAR